MVNISDSEAKAGFQLLLRGKVVRECSECGHLVHQRAKRHRRQSYVHVRRERKIKCGTDPLDLRIATPGKEWASGTH